MTAGNKASGKLSERDTLAPWTYLSPEFHELETILFKTQWLLAGHISSLRQPGDFITYDAVGERAFIIVDESGGIRAFHNVCRHRGAKLLDDSGNCKHRISCPFHGWSYDFNGALANVPLPETFKNLNKAEYGLKTLPVEIWHGFVFISFSAQSSTVAKRLQSVDEEVAPYKISEMKAVIPAYDDLRPYNWKVIHDIDNEGYHVPVGHPSLQQLYGLSYEDRIENGIPISDAVISDKPAKLWSVRNYQKVLPQFDHLPSKRQKSWWYIGLFPNAVIALYPDCVEYYMTIPVSVNQTRYLGGVFGLADDRREVQAARYLNMRINKETEAEDESFVSDMQNGMRSSVFPEPTLSSTELGVRYFHQQIQKNFPVARLVNEPSAGTVCEINTQLAAQHR